MRTTATESAGGTFVLNGEKVFISGADQCDFMLLIARDRERGAAGGRRAGFSLFMVDLTRPGVGREPLDIRWFAPEGQCTVSLQDVELPAEALVGERGKGFDQLLDSLNTERLIWAAGMLGIGEYALQRTVAYVKERAPFGAPIGSYQAVQHPLALAKMHLEAARHMTYAAAIDYEEGRAAGDGATMANFLAKRAALEAVGGDPVTRRACLRRRDRHRHVVAARSGDADRAPEQREHPQSRRPARARASQELLSLSSRRAVGPLDVGANRIARRRQPALALSVGDHFAEALAPASIAGQVPRQRRHARQRQPGVRPVAIDRSEVAECIAESLGCGRSGGDQLERAKVGWLREPRPRGLLCQVYVNEHQPSSGSGNPRHWRNCQ
jgi:hypothetical protein